MAKLVPKSTEHLLSALEDHLHLLGRTLVDLASGDAAYLRQLAAQLRALVCTSSSIPGLLWRLKDHFGVDDSVKLRYPGKVDTSNPITRGMIFAGGTIRADGSGPSAIPQSMWSLQEHIHIHEALFVDGVSVTHEHLISRLANETGVAHEAHGVSKEMAKINSILVGDVQPYFAVLDADARLVLEVGERVIAVASEQGYVRRRAPSLAAGVPPLELVRFNTRLDLPASPSPLDEGAVAIAVQVPENVRLKDRIDPVRFPSVTQGKVQISVEVTRKCRVRVRTVGLPLPYFGFEFPLPEAKDDTLAIVITWKRSCIKAFAAGVQVAGPVGEL